MPQTVNTKTWQLAATQHKRVVLDLWAPWCGPCRMIAPMLETLEGELPVTVLRLNIDDDKTATDAFHVQSIPTLILFKNGKAFEKITGAYPKAQLEAHLRQSFQLEETRDDD
ncbi:thioredoxin [Lacticaseibacillus mingshuiensis]|uniref:thioredoxin n=1 Tax=Lacticaseibacillus mingshuiensis TaxID=2799574 RepID=UPI001951B7E2|nr:thioredoxin [Lacticaseibacillus mingshuiensis]